MRPRIIDSPEQFDQTVDRYVEEVGEYGDPVTLTGLIMALGLSSRQSLAHYEERPEFCDSVRRAKLRVEHEYEKRLFSSSSSGAIFALKNFGWSENRTVRLESEQGISGFAIKLIQPQ
jgi:hypothetical protein